MSVLRLIPLKGEAIVVDADEALVGREANCNVVVSHPSVSRRHALLKKKQDVFFVVDQGSANGTFVDSKRIVDATLRDGCVLRFGSATFKVEIGEDLVVESIGEDELVVSSATIGPQSFSATVLEGAILATDDEPTPHYGTDMGSVPTGVMEVLAPTPTPKSEAPRPSRPADVRAPPPPPLAPPLPLPEPPPVPAAQAGQKGPAFWLMIAAGAVALLLVGAALGLVAAFVAKRMGFL